MRVLLTKSPVPTKKWRVVFASGSHVDFGSSGYSDFTIHRDPQRKQRYINRHAKRENWTNPRTAGFWSRWLLWEKPTLPGAIKFIENKFNVKIVKR